MNTSVLDYHLPKELIAQYPKAQRDASRLLVLHRDSGRVEHRVFSDVMEYLERGDVMVVNNTKVLPARVFGRKPSGAKVELLLYKKRDAACWEVLVKPSRRVRTGDTINLAAGIYAFVRERLDGSKRVIAFSKPVLEWLETIGVMPLPPYIEREATEEDRNAYQTVYAKQPGAVAAPTAGLHFTSELLQEIRNRGVTICEVTLHVGPGTFRPIRTQTVEEHHLAAEWAYVSRTTAEAINKAVENGNRVWAVGTTSVRTVEAFWNGQRMVGGSKLVDLYIHPPYAFGVVSGIITNFHLPCTSLLALVAAFGGVKRTQEAYQMAVKEQYRFYSYGDAMIVL